MKFKRDFIVTVIVIFCLSIFINFTGCGAIAAIVSAVFGSQGGFVFVPFLSDKTLSSEETGKLPGMIMLYSNNSQRRFLESSRKGR